MKKVLVLMLVLGIASMATAGLTITVNGMPAEDSSIVLAPSDYVLIGLYNDGSVDQTIGYMAIESGPGSWTGVGGTYYPPSVPSAYATYIGFTSGLGDTWVMINAEPTVAKMGVGIVGEFEFHCDDIGEVVLVYSDDLQQVHDTLIIHQIPEPVTMGLLGLGGLFLRRRK